MRKKKSSRTKWPPGFGKLGRLLRVGGGSSNTAASTRAPEELTLLNPKTIIEEVEVSDNGGNQPQDQQRDGGLDNPAGLKSENYPHVEITNESKIWPGWFRSVSEDTSTWTACVSIKPLFLWNREHFWGYPGLLFISSSQLPFHTHNSREGEECRRK